MGTVRWGLAVSDELSLLAHAVGTIAAADDPVSAVCQLVRERNITRIILGLPRRTDGLPGTLEKEVQALQAELSRKTGLPVELWDERLTTRMADRLLREQDVAGRRRRARIDQLAAEVLLQSYLDAHRA